MILYKIIYYTYYKFFLSGSHFFNSRESAVNWLSFSLILNLIFVIALGLPGEYLSENFFWIFLGGYFVLLLIQKRIIKKIGGIYEMKGELEDFGYQYKSFYGVFVVIHLVTSFLGLMYYLSQ